ncbi:pirin family protein [Paenibacillus sp. JX-17]|uniref:Pirin family protein n=1 Tax=Paenibacillus lacisoli TaxID=3064525 RepID=A0ABT9CEY1_9BACL|nr:pirin family protein [Paenibacillus sp. JX-17]MDO7907829.1 pirin family protein [Paenibacillus sp. JX-17]
MIKVITSEQRKTDERRGMHSELSFSYGNLDDPHNAHFGCCLLHNDNIMNPGEEQEEQLHHDLELVSYVYSGRLQHYDSLGHVQILEPGSVQVLTAGSGIRHREYNASQQEDVRYIQMWFLPRTRDTEPAYNYRSFTEEERLNVLLPVILSGGAGVQEGGLRMDQEVDLYVSRLDEDKQLEYRSRHSGQRRLHLFVLEGSLEISCEEGTLQLNTGDAARIQTSSKLKILSQGHQGPTEWMLTDMP